MPVRHRDRNVGFRIRALLNAQHPPTRSDIHSCAFCRALGKKVSRSASAPRRTPESLPPRLVLSCASCDRHSEAFAAKHWLAACRCLLPFAFGSSRATVRRSTPLRRPIARDRCDVASSKKGSGAFGTSPRAQSSPAEHLGRTSRLAALPRDHLRDIARVASALADGEARQAEVDGLWREVLDGRWYLVDHFERGNARYIVVSARPARRRAYLSNVEGLVVRMAAQGAANKTIAFELLISTSTVATHLRRALSKLRPWSRSKLCIVHGFLFEAEAPIDGHADIAGVDPDGQDRPLPVEPKSRTLRIIELVWPGNRLKVVSTLGKRRVTYLTQSELDVAWSAVSGMSNSDIALARESSPRTIANQLASAFRKLGVTSRTELAAVLFSTSRKRIDR